MARPLGRFETAAALSHDHAPFVVVAVVELDGGPAPDRLAAALASLQRRHPLLQVRITERGRGYGYDTNGVGPIPLSLVARSDGEHWQRVAELELNRRIDDRHGPLVRCTYLQPAVPSASCELVLTLHHAIVDGVSGAHLLHELLECCAGAAEVEVAATAGLPLPADARLPRPAWGLSGLRRRLAFLGREAAGEALYRLRSAGERRSVPAATSCRLLPVRLSRDATSTLVRATRRRRLTLPSALNAAFLLAVRRHLHGCRSGLARYMTFADLRPYLEPPVAAQELGSYITMLRHTTRIDGDDFWELARRICCQVEVALRRGDKLTSALLCETMMRLVLGQKRHRMATVAVSYSGSARLERRYGGLQVRGVHGFVSNFSLGPEYTAQARLLWGELVLDVVYLDDEMERSLALVLAEDILETLRREAAVVARDRSAAPV